MNRILKFRRAHFFDSQKTRFSHYTEWGVKIGALNNCAEFTSPSSNNFALFYDDEQFTGLKDKNGKEVYEGDMLRGFKKEQSDKEGIHGYWLNDTVRWHKGAFQVFSKSISEIYTDVDSRLTVSMWHESGLMVNRNGYYYQIDQIEVIGNIYENPELLSNTIHEKDLSEG